MKNKRNAPRGIFLLTPAERRLVELATELPQWRWVKPFLPENKRSRWAKLFGVCRMLKRAMACRQIARSRSASLEAGGR